MNTVAITQQFVDRSNDVTLSPRKMAQRLKIQYNELAKTAGVHHNTINTHPESPHVQAFLHNVLRIIASATEVFGDGEAAIQWMMNEPVSAFHYKTAYSILQHDQERENRRCSHLY